VIYGITIVIVLQALSTLFQTGVYLYASTSQVPATLDGQLLERAFRPKK
jgi:hypothetical protein